MLEIFLGQLSMEVNLINWEWILFSVSGHLSAVLNGDRTSTGE